MTARIGPVDVLMVNYGTGDLAREACKHVAGEGVRILVWDNSGELLAGAPPGVELDGTGVNVFFADANNALHARGSSPYVLLLNPDVLLAHADLLRLVTALEQHEDCWGAAPRLLEPDGSDQRYLHALPTLTALLADRLPPLQRLLRRSHRRYRQLDVDLGLSQVVEQPPAACLLVRRDVLGERLFDPAYRLFFNDTDLARRLNATGGCWYAAEVTARHLRGASFARLGKGYAVAREYDRALLRYARANVRGWPVLVPVVAVRWLASMVLDVVRGRPRSL